jgi:hypothetical protein
VRSVGSIPILHKGLRVLRASGMKRATDCCRFDEVQDGPSGVFFVDTIEGVLW